MTEQHDNLDRELADYLSRRLDPHRGRALAALQTEWQRERRRRLILFTGAGLAVAASITIAFMLWATWDRAGSSSTPITAIATDAPRNLEQLIAWETSDQGVASLDQDHPPVRTLLQQGVQQATWFDPQRNATMRLTVPQEQIILIEEDTY